MIETQQTILNSLPCLALAEDVDSALLIRAGEQLLQLPQRGDPVDTTSILYWNSLETGVATQDQALVDQAFDGFRIVLDHPNAGDLSRRTFFECSYCGGV